MRTLEKRGLSEGMGGVYGGITASRIKTRAHARKDLYENYNLVKSSDHPNKDLVDKFNLECGSGFGIQYTQRIISSANQLKSTQI
jgi:hypothetical protein